MPSFASELTPLTVTAVALVAINIATFVIWGIDKWKAGRGAWRIPEKTLLLFSFCGGWPAAWLAAKTFRHKSSKQSFRRKLMGVTILNLAVVAGLLWAVL
jgi:uncharacterized membrane protein YsdA (DUF1294 family)